MYTFNSFPKTGDFDEVNQPLWKMEVLLENFPKGLDIITIIHVHQTNLMW